MSFNIKIDRVTDAKPDDPHGIEIGTENRVFTKLFRDGSNKIETFLRARPASLAFWLIDNWWRLRWEAMPLSNPPPPAWRLAHSLSDIGGGASWPQLSIWGEGRRIGLSAKPDPIGILGPVRFVEEGISFVPAEEWEAGVDQFLEMAQDEQQGFGSDRLALRTQLSLLNEERADEQISTWRRIEARLGYDVDQAPDQIIEDLIERSIQFEEKGIEEAIQACPGPEAVSVIDRVIKAARASRLVCSFQDAKSAAGVVDWDPQRPIWEPAEKAALNIRKELSRIDGPIRNKNLAEILGISSTTLGSVENSPANDLPYGLRVHNVKKDDGSQIVALKSRRSHDRRFEIARALGDVIWAGPNGIGPVTQTKTDRQRFQRAFAQSLLCPFDDLKQFIDKNGSDDEGIMAAAQHYHVNTKVIERTLVKKRVLSAERFEDLLEAS